MSGYVIHYDIAGIIIMFALFVQYYSAKRINLGWHRLYIRIMWLASLTLVSDLGAAVLINKDFPAQPWAYYAINMVYMISLHASAFLFYRYVRQITGCSSRISAADLVVSYLPITVGTALILSTPFTHFIFYFDESGDYTYGVLQGIFYFVPFYYIVLVLVTTLIYRNRMMRARKNALIIFSVGFFVIMIFQYLNPLILLAHFVIAVALIILYIMFENPEKYMNRRLGVMNRQAALENIDACLRAKRKLDILGIQISGLDFLHNTLKIRDLNGVLKMTKDIIEKNADRDCRVFSISQNRFAIMAEGAAAGGLETVAEDIKNDLSEKMRYEGHSFYVGSIMVLISDTEYGEDVQSGEILEMLTDSFADAARTERKLLKVDRNAYVEKNLRADTIIYALREAVIDRRFDVVYQPIYSVREGRFTKAEALVRLSKDSPISSGPEEFISIAEQNGLISDIGMIVFEKVCEFLAKGEITRLGIETIHVNLSAVQCMQEDLHDRFKYTMDRYGLPYSRISLELTEEMAARSAQMLLYNMERFSADGIRFSMDDFGVGFSNIANIIKYPFSEIKLDKSFIWRAMEDENAMRIVEHSAAMIKSLKMDVLCEGVETKEQAEILKKIGADYFQGFYYSKPISEEELIAGLKSGSLLR